MPTKIDWVKNQDDTQGETLNVTTGCTPISAGCKNCYAQKMSMRLKAMGLHKYRNGFKVTLHPEELKKPFKWKKPRTIFLNSMSDLFHEDVPDEFIFEVFAMMNKCSRHTFQVLTKRPERASKLSHKLTWTDNIWMGTTIEDRKTAHRVEYIPYESRIKFISFEPLLEVITWTPYQKNRLRAINWFIIGGETGQRPRRLDINSIYSVLDSFRREIPFFFKGWGTTTIKKSDPQYYKFQGREWREMPGVV